MSKYLPATIDSIEEGRSKLLTQYETDFAFFNNLLDVQLKKINEVDTALQDILTRTSIFSATGVTLDVIGAVIDIYRGELSDDSFRQLILSRLSNNVSNGTPQDIMSAVKSFTNASSCKYWPYFPANYVLETNGLNISNSLEDSVKSLSPISVGYFAILSSRNDSVFRPAELNQLTGNLIDNNSSIIASYDGFEVKNIDVIYSQTEYEVHALNTSILPDVVEVTDTGEIYLVDNNINQFVDNLGNYIITGINLGWKEIVLNNNNSRLSEVYQYNDTNLPPSGVLQAALDWYYFNNVHLHKKLGV